MNRCPQTSYADVSLQILTSDHCYLHLNAGDVGETLAQRLTTLRQRLTDVSCLILGGQGVISTRVASRVVFHPRIISNHNRTWRRRYLVKHLTLVLKLQAPREYPC